jgi:hypothetical protein
MRDFWEVSYVAPLLNGLITNPSQLKNQETFQLIKLLFKPLKEKIKLEDQGKLDIQLIKLMSSNAY